MFATRHPSPPRVPGRARAAIAIAVALLATLLAGIAATSAAPVWSEVRPFPEQDGMWGRASMVLSDGRPRTLLPVQTEDGVDLRYAWCDAGCDQASSWSSVVIAKLDTGFFPGVLRVDATGRPHVLYQEGGAFRYATCSATCDRQASWRSGVVDGDGNPRVHAGTLAIDPQGRPRVAYFPQRSPYGTLHYAECDADCTVTASWRTLVLPEVGNDDGIALEIDERGAVHVAAGLLVVDADVLTPSHAEVRYVTCAAACTSGVGRWSAPVAIPDTWRYSVTPKLAVHDGSVSLAYVVADLGEVRVAFATCAAACTSSGNWTGGFLLDLRWAVTATLALTADGRPRVAYTYCEFCLTDKERGRPHYAWCDANCGESGSWTTQEVTFSGGDAFTDVLVLHGERPRLLFTDASRTPAQDGFAWCDEACGAPPSTTTSSTSTTSTSTSTSTTSTTSTTSSTTTTSTTSTTTTTTTTRPTSTTSSTTTTTPTTATTTTTARPPTAPAPTSTSSQPTHAPPAPPPRRSGTWLVGSDGGVFTGGDAPFFGSTGALRLNQPIVGIAGRPRGDGYWFVARDGGVFAFGGAPFAGSTGNIRLNQPIVGMAATPTGHGYWLVARDGGIFAFGDAPFLGSTGALRLNQPIVGMAATPTGRGYWLVARDGGVFAFGDAPFLGSAGALRLNQPIVGMAARPQGDGYWFVAADGGVFTFGAARYHGSATSRTTAPITGMAATPTGDGYWLAAADGTTYAFGDATPQPPPPSPPAYPIVGITALHERVPH